MKITRTITAAALVSTTALAIVGVGAESASAKSPEVRSSGSCSASTDWKLKAKGEDSSRLEVELEIDSNRNGQKWYLSISDNAGAHGGGHLRAMADAATAASAFPIRRNPQASDGEEAVRLAVQVRPDVVLMDLSMPVVDGVEATRRVLAELPETKIVVLTSFSARERVAGALQAGAVGYLLKDCEPQELQRDQSSGSRSRAARPTGRARPPSRGGRRAA